MRRLSQIDLLDREDSAIIGGCKTAIVSRIIAVRQLTRARAKGLALVAPIMGKVKGRQSVSHSSWCRP